MGRWPDALSFPRAGPLLLRPDLTLDIWQQTRRIADLSSAAALYKNLILPRNTDHPKGTRMSRIFHPLLYSLVSATRQELARQVHYLETENQILRSKLPKRVLVTPTERRQLVKAGRGLGEAIKELVAIVQPSTLLRWINGDDKPKSKKKASSRKPGRPRMPEDVRALVVRIATETGWGYTRVLGELRKLDYRLSRQTVKNILVEHGIDPGPKRGKGTWDEFIRIHAATMWATDFCSKWVWTLRGPIDLYLLVFLQIGSRRAWQRSGTHLPGELSERRLLGNK